MAEISTKPYLLRALLSEDFELVVGKRRFGRKIYIRLLQMTRRQLPGESRTDEILVHPGEPRDMLFVCTGGGPGIMEAANRGAHEADGISVGLSIALPMEEAANPYVTPALSFKFHYFALRKMHFMMRAKALVAFPGGFGTLAELFEVITLVQTRKSRQVPIVLFGSDYWKRLVNFELLVEEGMISAADLELFQFADEPEAAWEIIRNFYRL